MSSSLTVWVVGATGLVGRETVKQLLTEPSVAHVVAAVRRPLDLEDAKLEARVVDFDHLALEGRADVAICCLGTTIKVAGSKARFRIVDFDYVVAFAEAAKAAGVSHFIVVTALGADARSMTFYNRVKGEVEQALTALSFDALTIARPSLLLGERAEMRFGERIAAPLSKLLPKSVRGIEGRSVARALVRLAIAPAKGERIVPSGELTDLGA